uniref:Uncharacterized protein n=1 Tax=Oryza barthii TaxID=65489 RepID=A0A0D3GTZ0_9ORYZ
MARQLCNVGLVLADRCCTHACVALLYTLVENYIRFETPNSSKDQPETRLMLKAMKNNLLEGPGHWPSFCLSHRPRKNYTLDDIGNLTSSQLSSIF